MLQVALLHPLQIHKGILGENRIAIEQRHNQNEQPDSGGREYTFLSERLKRKEL